MEIVILDGYAENPGDLSWSGFEALGGVTVYDRTPVNQIAERIGRAEAVIVNKVPITRETMDACPGIRYIGLLATGYDVVDIHAATEKGIVVCNVPSYGTEVVAQFAFALLLEICSNVGWHSRAVQEGRWAAGPDWCFWDYPLIELKDKTMGIIGFGRIGQATGRIARAMGMRVIAVDEYPTDAGRAIGDYVSLEMLLAEADVIALHCNLTPATKHIVSKATIAKMKNGVIIINNSRGALVMEQDLADALNSGKVYAAGLDVVSTEPIRDDNPLRQAKNCFITPHISWAAKESRQRLMDIALANLRAFVDGTPQNAVNPKK